MKSRLLLSLGLILSSATLAQDLTFQEILELKPEAAPLTRSPDVHTQSGVRRSLLQSQNIGYDDKALSEKWHDAHGQPASCDGRNQSPVDIRAPIDAELEAIRFSYDTPPPTAEHNGHTLQLTYPTSRYLNADGLEFHLRLAQVFTPSENRIEGSTFPMEIQLVHEAHNGEMLVVAVMVTEGEHNPAFNRILQAIPGPAGGTTELGTAIEPTMLLPDLRDYYRFNGSLTSPPCTEGVRWIVMKNAISLSSSQLTAMSKAIGTTTNRPIQPLNARLILE